MKRILLVPALAALLLTSCKDDPELEAPEITAIEFSKDRIASGQLITITPTVTDKDTDQSNLIFKWTSSDGLSSNDQTAKWVPSSTGSKTITLTVDDLNTKITKDAAVDVIEPDFRRGLWGDKRADIENSEDHAGNQQLTPPTDDLLAYQGNEEIAADVYYFDNKIFVQAATFYFPEYPEAELNRYVTDFNARKSSLSATYGDPFNEVTEWASAEAEAMYKDTPEQWGRAIAAGELVLASVWKKTENTGLVLMLRDDGDGGILLVLFYVPTDEGGRHAVLSPKGMTEFVIGDLDKIRTIKKSVK